MYSRFEAAGSTNPLIRLSGIELGSQVRKQRWRHRLPSFKVARQALSGVLVALANEHERRQRLRQTRCGGMIAQ